MTKLLGREVVVIGVGMHPWGKFPQKSPIQLGCEAVLRALDDAGLEWHDIQYLVASVSPEIKGNETILPGQVLCEKMGELGIPVINVSNVCGGGGVAVKVAYQAVALGECDIALAVGFDCSPEGFFLGAPGPQDINDTNFMRWSIAGAPNPSHWAMECRKRMEKYGTTEHTLAMTKVLASRNSVHNSYARYRKAYTVEDVLASPMVCEPLRLLEICATSDGAAAVILGSMDVAKKLTTKLITVAATTTSHAKYGDGTVHLVGIAYHGEQETPVASEGYIAAKMAYEHAGIGPEDLDIIELPDNSAWHYLNYLESLGLAKEGEADQLVEQEATAIGGKIPCCTSGGFASFGETTAAMGQFQICELVWQLRGVAGPRQVEGAKVGLAQLYGGNGNCTVTILKT
ncbi:MAG: transporter [Thermodesulfobacteriota bacterium]|jgi:acetyl-CoA acetyltransferase